MGGASRFAYFSNLVWLRDMYRFIYVVGEAVWIQLIVD